MQGFDVLEELVNIIERQKSAGQRTVSLSPQTRADLFTDARGPRSRPPARPGRARPDLPQSRPPPLRLAESEPPATEPDASPAQTTGPPLSELDLTALERRVAGCRMCPLHRERKQTVFARGKPQARLMFIGEGPGYEEDEQGLPFVGAAGKLLDRMISAMQFDRDEVYIANIVKCHPPRNRVPDAEEAQACLPFLIRQIELVQPEVIVLLGAVPLRYLLGIEGINRAHGQWADYQGTPVLPTFHPAYLLRVEQKKREAWQDLQKVMRRLGKDPDETTRRGRE